MNTCELIRMQLSLECIGLDQDGLLVPIPGPDPDEIARVYVFYREDNYRLFFRYDLDASIRAQISELPPERVFHDLQTIKTILANRGRGYGRQTTAAWAYHLQQLGKVPFYSHAQANPASRRMAESLGLIPCFSLVNYD